VDHFLLVSPAAGGLGGSPVPLREAPGGPAGRDRQYLKADDLRRGSGGVQQAADVGGITGDDISVQLRSGMSNHSINYITGASAA
jgi:hypothetical protein